MGALRAEPPRAGRRGSSAFTLVELLIVVGIVALLLGLVGPTLSRVKDLARKALCAAQLRTYGTNIHAYVAAHGTYPRLGSSQLSDPPYAKIYAVMEMYGIAGRKGPDDRTYYDHLPFNQIWEKALCPAMDAVSIWKAGAEAGGYHPQAKADFAAPGIGYQWSVTLRGRERANGAMPDGRYPPNPYKVTDNWYPYKVTDWIWWIIHMRDGEWYMAQALSPQEVENPGSCAEGWDGIDLGSVPREVYWGRSPSDWETCEYECLVPGWNVGAQTCHANGWALLPADRHPGGSPNILYVNGSVRCDATRRITRQDVPEIAARMPAGSQMHLVSWDDYLPLYGTTGHLLPRRKIIRQWP